VLQLILGGRMTGMTTCMLALQVPDELAEVLDRQADELMKQLPPERPALLDSIKPKDFDALKVGRCG
jgi:hypothetical protein